MAAQILIVDSDPSAAEDLRSMLDEDKCEISHVLTGPDAEQIARENPPDAMILCVDVPNGFSHSRHFKKDESLASVPLILTSSRVASETFRKHSKLPTAADGYILKPFSAEEMLLALAEVVSPSVSESLFDFAPPQGLTQISESAPASNPEPATAEHPAEPAATPKVVSQLNDAIGALHASEERISALTSNLDNLEAEKDKEVGGLAAELEKLKEAREASESLANHYLEALQAQADSLKKLEERNEELDGELTKVRAHEDELATNLNEVIVSQEDAETLSAELTVAKGRIAALEEKKKELDRALASYEETMHATSSLLKEQADTRGQYERDLVSLNNESDTLRTELDTTRGRLAQYESTVTDIRAKSDVRTDALEMRLVELGRDNDRLEVERDAAYGLKDQLETERNTVQEENAIGVLALTETQEAKKQIHQNLTEALETLATRDASIEDLEEKLSSTRESLDGTKNRVTALETGLKEVTDAKTVLEEIFQRQKEALETSNIAQTAEIERLTQAIGQARDADIALRQELGNTREKLTEFQTDASNTRQQLETALHQALEEKSQLGSELKETRNRHESLQKAVQTESERADQAEVDLKIALEKIESQGLLLSEEITKREELEKTVSTQENQIRELDKILHETKELVPPLEEALASAKKEIERLETNAFEKSNALAVLAGTMGDALEELVDLALEPEEETDEALSEDALSEEAPLEETPPEA